MATLSTGADAEGGERFGACEYNDIKNHWRTPDPCANLSDLQPGMIVSDENDDRLYVVSLVSGCPCSEIVQSCVPLSDDKYIGFGDGREGDLGYNSTHCALMMGIPVATLDSGSCERGLIIMDEADLQAGADVTGIVPPSMAEPVVFIVDSDIDSYLGAGHQVDDRPGIWSGPTDANVLAIQYDANADVTFFENSGVGENRVIWIYGDDGGVLKWGKIGVTAAGVFRFQSFFGENIYLDSGNATYLNREAFGDIYLFSNSLVGVNLNFMQYGYITAGAAVRFSRFRMDDTNDEFEIEAENSANHEGITVLIQEGDQKFRVRGAARALRFYVKSDGEIGTNQAVPAGHSGGYTPGVISDKIPIYDENQSYIGDIAIYETLS